MTETTRSESDKRKSDNADLYVRAACAADIDGFLAVARLYVEESGLPFNEEAARYLFGGLPRADPLVNL